MFMESVSLEIIDILENRDKIKRPLLIAIQGAQGCGKSTFAALISSKWQSKYPKSSTLAISIDDFYYVNEKDIDKRGNPGTHDMDMFHRVFQELLSSGIVRVPRFDKAKKKRFYELVTKKPELIILEGWCVGFTSFTDSKYTNDKFIQDINQELCIHYDHVWRDLRIDIFLIMYPCSLDWIYNWRQEQEVNTKKLYGNGMSSDQVKCLVERCMDTYKLWTSRNLSSFLFNQQKIGKIGSILLLEQDQYRSFVSITSLKLDSFRFPWEYDELHNSVRNVQY